MPLTKDQHISVLQQLILQAEVDEDALTVQAQIANKVGNKDGAARHEANLLIVTKTLAELRKQLTELEKKNDQ
jgi:hypothetical protein